MRRGKWLGLAALVTVSALLPIGLAELSFRAMDVKTGFLSDIPSPSNCLRRSASLGLDFAPDCQGTLDSTPVRTNSIGLRDDEIAEDGSVRVLSIGDSCTWGWGVPEDQAYPRVLEGLLNSSPGSAKFRVINAGRPGYTSYQGLVHLRELGPALEPAIVLFAYGYNDATHRGDVERDIEWQRPWLPLLEANDFLLRYSKLMRWLNYKAISASLQHTEPPAPAANYRRNLTRIVERIRELGAKPVMISFWDAGRGDIREAVPNWGAAYRDAAAEAAAELGVPTVVYSGPRMDIVHPTREGYARLAADVQRALSDQGYLADGADRRPLRQAAQ